MPKSRCDHCGSTAPQVACAVCNRDMCESCIRYGDAGKMCGLCKDREDGVKRWVASGELGSFEEWYDKNG